MGMMIKFRSRQPTSCSMQSNNVGNNCESSSTASTSSQPHSPTSTGPSLPSPSLSSFTSSNGVLSSDSPTLKSAGFEISEQKPKAGILVHNSLSTLCYRPASAEESSTINRISSFETQDEIEKGQGDIWSSAQTALRESQRPSSHSDLPSLRFDETESQKQHQRNPSKSIYQNKHVAYATVFDGSIVRRREITTPSSTNSYQPSPRGSPKSKDCEPLPTTTTTITSPNHSPTTSSPPQYEYSRIYYSNGNSQKRKGLRGILAR